MKGIALIAYIIFALLVKVLSLAWLCEYDAMSMSDLTSINTILSGDMF